MEVAFLKDIPSATMPSGGNARVQRTKAREGMQVNFEKRKMIKNNTFYFKLKDTVFWDKKDSLVDFI